MKIPPNMTEQEVLAVITKVSERMGQKYKFAHYQAEDIVQECYVFCIKGLEYYDGVRPLENFLSRHVRYRLLNLKRDVGKRVECPCKLCLEFPTKHKDGKYCDRYLLWEKINSSKQALCSTAEVFEKSEDRDDYENLEVLEKKALIDQNMPANLRPYYLKMKAGVCVNKTKKTLVENFIRGLFEKNDRKETEFS